MANGDNDNYKDDLVQHVIKSHLRNWGQNPFDMAEDIPSSISPLKKAAPVSAPTTTPANSGGNMMGDLMEMMKKMQPGYVDPNASTWDRFGQAMGSPATQGLLHAGLSMLATPPRQEPYGNLEMLGRGGIAGLQGMKEAAAPGHEMDKMLLQLYPHMAEMQRMSRPLPPALAEKTGFTDIGDLKTAGASVSRLLAPEEQTVETPQGKMSAKYGYHYMGMGGKNKTKEQIAEGELTERLGRKPTFAELKTQLADDEVKADKDLNKFKVLYPDMKDKEGTPEFAKAYESWFKDMSKTTFMEKASTGKVAIGTPEQQEADVRAILGNQMTIDDATKAGGMGGAGGAYARQLRAEILKREPTFNFNLQKMIVKGDQAEINKMNTMRGQILSFEQTAIQNAKQVYHLADQIDPARIPELNKLILLGKTSVAGDSVASSYLLAWRTFINEYARVSTTVSGGGVTSDTARKEMEEVIKKSETKEMLQAGMRQAVLEMKHREYGYDVQLEAAYNRWGGRKDWKAELPTAEDIYQIFATPGPNVVPPSNLQPFDKVIKTKDGRDIKKLSDKELLRLLKTGQ